MGEMKDRIAEMIRQGYSTREIKSVLGVSQYQIKSARDTLPADEAYPLKNVKTFIVSPGFSDEWNAARNSILHPGEVYVPAGFWDEWDAVRGTLLKAKRKEAAG